MSLATYDSGNSVAVSTGGSVAPADEDEGLDDEDEESDDKPPAYEDGEAEEVVVPIHKMHTLDSYDEGVEQEEEEEAVLEEPAEVEDGEEEEVNDENVPLKPVPVPVAQLKAVVQVAAPVPVPAPAAQSILAPVPVPQPREPLADKTALMAATVNPFGGMKASPPRAVLTEHVPPHPVAQPVKHTGSSRMSMAGAAPRQQQSLDESSDEEPNPDEYQIEDRLVHLF